MKLSCKYIIYIVLMANLSIGCSKMIDIDEPIDTVTSVKVFLSDDQADQALAGLYSQLIGNSGLLTLTNGAGNIYAGLAADEFVPNNVVLYPEDNEIFSNNILVENKISENILWSPTYRTVFTTNAILDGEAASTSATLTKGKRNELIASAKFVRAFCFFNLTGFYGGIPITLSSNYKKNISITRSTQQQVYEQIIDDLEHAVVLFTEGTTQSPTLKSRAGKNAVEILLARAYLYAENWERAEYYANEVITKGGNELGTLIQTFETNSKESIFQLSVYPGIGTLHESFHLSPGYPLYLMPESDREMILDPGMYPDFAPMLIPKNYLSDHLVNAFENGDQRKEVWANSNGSANIAPYFGRKYYFANKYVRDDINETSYTVLRLAEAYLIRAEARAMQNKVELAAEDIDKIRQRAGLAKTTANDKDALLLAIEQERRVELFAEWGHRFFDLKRTGRALEVLSAIPEKSAVNENRLSFPIPVGEIVANPKLTQNPGY